MLDKKRVLVLAPHTDDGEFGCGATINKLIEEGSEVYYVAFSACEQSVLAHLPKDVLVSEVKAATQTLGVKKENLILYRYEVRTFNYHRQAILDDIIQLKNDIKPDLIFTPSVNDIHQDHATISNEAIRAFKFSSILCYELPWNNFNFTTSCFSTLSEKHLEKKVLACQEYRSQSHRPYADANFIKSLARVRGVQAGIEYAEVFEVVRWII